MENSIMIKAKGWEQAENILCVRLDTIGDVLMTTPAMRALKEARPGRKLSLLTSQPGAAIAPLVPELDEVIVYDAPWLKATAPRLDSRPEYEMVERLRQGHFEAAVIFTVFSQNPLPSAFLCYLADIPLRLAYCHENPYQLLSDWVSDPDPAQGIRHEVRRQLDLVATLGCQPSHERLSLSVPNAALERVGQILAELELDPARPWTIIHPGATAASRRYPAESFGVVAQQLAQEHNWQVIFTGSGAEHELVEQIRAKMGATCPSYSLVNKLNLAELSALIWLAPILIANNTGPIHMAAALGTPVIDLYALTNPQHTPWQVPQRILSYDVPCKYCYKSICPQGHHHCLRLIRPAEVVQAALELWAETNLEIERAIERTWPPFPEKAGGAINICI